MITSHCVTSGLIDGALAELAEVLGLDITSYDTGPTGDPVTSAGLPDPAPGPASNQPSPGLPG